MNKILPPLLGALTLGLLGACQGGRDGTANAPAAAVPTLPARAQEQNLRLSGQVMGPNGALAGALISVRGSESADTLSDLNGRFALSLPAGSYTLTASAECHANAAQDIALTEDLQLDVTLAQGKLLPPGAPSGLRGNSGPGIAQATVAWSAPDAAGSGEIIGFALYRDGEALARFGNTLAYGDTGVSGTHSYAVAAINSCGVEGPLSTDLSVTALPGQLLEAPVTPASEAEVSRNTYTVLDARGKPAGQRVWRTVRGLGNCCETYVATDAYGKLYEYGGSYIFVSEDEGRSWQRVSNVLPTVNAEGAAAGAPGGDMVAVNWDPYTGDQLFTHKYVRATDTWYTARTPLHQPLFDRPWVATVEGPFEFQGMTVPYVSFLMSNYVHGDVLLMSLDGLQYQAPNLRELTQGSTPVSLDFLRDPERDWTQAMRQASMSTLDNGLGLRDRHLRAGCAQAVLSGVMDWSCPDWGHLEENEPKANEVVRIDSAGNAHVTTITTGDVVIAHRLSTDGGLSWKRAQTIVPNRMFVEDWDVQVNAALDQVVIVVHAKQAGGVNPQTNQDMVFRFVDLNGDFRLKEILLVGNGDHVFGEGLGAADDRFDFTTVALLPSGHVALSFGDAAHVPPAIAIETDLPAD